MHNETQAAYMLAYTKPYNPNSNPCHPRCTQGRPCAQRDAGRLHAGLLKVLNSYTLVPDICGACRGDPAHNETQAAYMLAYSPLDNVRAQAYPHMLASGGAHV